MDITVLEIHLPDAEFVAPGGRITAAPENDDDTDDDADAVPGDGSGSAGALIALVVLIGLIVLAWALRGAGTDEGAEDRAL